MPSLRRSFLPLLLAGLLATSCATPDADTPADDELSGTPGGDAIDEPDPEVDESDLDGEDPDREGPTGDEQRGEDFDGEALTDADLTSRLSSSLGTHLVDGQGRTLYVFAADPAGERTCTGECLQTWPIFSTGEETPTVDGEVREELVGTIPGDLQVTYNEQPLYYYVGDDTVGDVNGQGLADEWFVVATEGVPVE
jgi:predicted lipoprotein with Yx(FWY)xxD motif